MANSWASSEGTRAVMQGNRSRDTAPEIRVRRAVHALGLRYRVAARPLPGERLTADLVFRRVKVAVFVDGCYWHGCPEHYREARTNHEFWAAKIAANKARDRRADEALAAHGWLSLRVWEHDEPGAAAGLIAARVREREPTARSRGRGDAHAPPLPAGPIRSR